MTNQQVATRYAKSLLDLALERNELNAIKGDVDSLVEMGANRDLALVLQSPVINTTKKKAIFAELLDKAGAQELTKTFVSTLIGKGREADLVGILNAFDEQYKSLNKITTVNVTSATALDDSSLQTIKSQLAAAGKTEANIEIVTKVDPSILGGFILEFDGKVYDASVAHKLNEIRKELVN
ncbi:ATP synthase F1 subunit delta [Neolewinella aurantiaca]|uniref:ATP synthase subunit delta n=1 Tax=Neolewinella aurantiaca TaxID=2602767 RepID=A0A5C7FJ90_9BACT|nr:ATP synthase F1 subunit delta [Neolewinella aurantiaca]TXF91272.1 ATP synthase F1 subunit delta [Neolewinella aurantiaca]